MGLNKVYRFDHFVWRDSPFPLQLSKDTFVYGEFVFEVSRTTYTRRIAFHIIDAFRLGSTDIRNLHYVQRLVEYYIFTV